MNVPVPSVVALFIYFPLNHNWFQRKTEPEHKPIFVSVQRGRTPLFTCKHIVQVSWRKCCHLTSPTLSMPVRNWWLMVTLTIFLQVSPALERYVPDPFCLLFLVFLISSFSFTSSQSVEAEALLPACGPSRSFFLLKERLFPQVHDHKMCWFPALIQGGSAKVLHLLVLRNSRHF